MRELAKRLLPPAFRSSVQGIFEDAADLVDKVRGRRNGMMPPRKLIRNIGGSFTEVGDTFLRHFIELGGLQPSHDVLDVGCGIGRMAVPLTHYLGYSGNYEGFDIDAKEIRWCTRHITSRNPNFHFQVADIYSKRYNPRGRHAASNYKFPYANERFDFVFLTSVCTHLLPSALENYLGGVSRVLKTGSRCLMTFFLLNDESLRLIEARRSTVSFAYNHGWYRISDEHVPEWAVAFDEVSIMQLCEKYGLNVQKPVRLGNWCGRADGYDYQDIVIATKI